MSRRLASAHGTHTPSIARGRGGISLYLLSWFESAALVVLALLSTGVAADGQTLTFRNPRDLLVAGPVAFIELLEAARPAPLSREDMGAILRALPSEGRGYRARSRRTEESGCGSPVAHGNPARLVRDQGDRRPASRHRSACSRRGPDFCTNRGALSAAELQATAAHEIGHEYVWTEWNRAQQYADQERLKELELVCDAIAASRSANWEWIRLK